MKKNFRFIHVLWLALGLISWVLIKHQTPTLYLVGDSTVADGSDKGELHGWGKFLPDCFNLSKIHIKNYAVGGTSTRTFRTKGVWKPELASNGLWDSVFLQLKKGDFVLIEFGHNDASPVNDSARSRGTIKGISDDSIAITNLLNNKQEVVHSYGWYLKAYIKEIKSKGATPIICSPVAENQWLNGKLDRKHLDYTEWAKAVAEKEKVAFIDMNKIIADQYDAEGETKVRANYFNKKDPVHTLTAGAQLNASLLADALRTTQSCSLKKYLLPKKP